LSHCSSFLQAGKFKNQIINNIQRLQDSTGLIHLENHHQGTGCGLVSAVGKSINNITDCPSLFVRIVPKQLQATLYSIISLVPTITKPIYTGDAYDRYRTFCMRIKLHALTQRAFSNLVSELDMYGFIQARVHSKGRYGRIKEIMVNLPETIVAKLRQVVLMEFDLNRAL